MTSTKIIRPVSSTAGAAQTPSSESSRSETKKSPGDQSRQPLASNAQRIVQKLREENQAQEEEINAVRFGGRRVSSRVYSDSICLFNN